MKVVALLALQELQVLGPFSEHRSSNSSACRKCAELARKRTQ
jgi:hypothetical protein